MPGVALHEGTSMPLAASAANAAGTLNTDPYWLVKGGGLLLTIDLTNANGGSIDTVSIQAKTGDNYDTVISFTGQAITANGRYIYRIEPGAANAGDYKGAAENSPPLEGRVQIVSTVATMTFAVDLACI